jgi:alkaline phosphatase
MKLNRLAIILISVSTILLSLNSCDFKDNKSHEAKYVFYFIGDGMGYQQISATQAFLNSSDSTIGIKDLSFTDFPVSGVASTYAYNRYITGSAAAGTALATGSKTSIGTIGLNHNHTDSLYSIAYHAHQAGFQVGIVTSVSIDHATPAAFYAHQPSRDLYHNIAHDLIQSGFRFFGSGGLKDPEGKKSEVSLGNVYEKGLDNGFYFTSNLSIPDSILESHKSIFYSSPNPSYGASLQYQIDNSDTDVTLAQITSKAIDILNNPKGFFLMVEGGKIDWACHDNDAASTIHEMIAFSDAIAVAFEFYLKYPKQTLIVVTSDHETGGMSVGNRQNSYESNVSLLANQKYSLDKFKVVLNDFFENKKQAPSFNQLLEFVSNELGIGTENQPLSVNQIFMLERAYNASILKQTPEQKKKNREEFGSSEPIAATAISIFNQIAGIGWSSFSHTGSHVPVYAIGAGQERFSGQMDNTDIPKRIAKTMQLSSF